MPSCYGYSTGFLSGRRCAPTGCGLLLGRVAFGNRRPGHISDSQRYRVGFNQEKCGSGVTLGYFLLPGLLYRADGEVPGAQSYCRTRVPDTTMGLLLCIDLHAARVVSKVCGTVMYLDSFSGSLTNLPPGLFTGGLLSYLYQF